MLALLEPSHFCLLSTGIRGMCHCPCSDISLLVMLGVLSIVEHVHLVISSVKQEISSRHALDPLRDGTKLRLLTHMFNQRSPAWFYSSNGYVTPFFQSYDKYKARKNDLVQEVHRLTS